MDWNLVAIIAAVIAFLSILFSGAFWIKFKNLLKQTREFMDVVCDALEDDNISSEELAIILREARDVGSACMDITRLFNR